jgi:UDP-N-acetyl-D-mannosaminuronate dehydrogenase
MDLSDNTLAIIGSGYVGLPLAVEFGKKRPVIGFDINPRRVTELLPGKDQTVECSRSELKEAKQVRCSCKPADLGKALGAVTNSDRVDALVVAAGHNQYRQATVSDLRTLCRSGKSVLVDVKSHFNRREAECQGFTVFGL